MRPPGVIKALFYDFYLVRKSLVYRVEGNSLSWRNFVLLSDTLKCKVQRFRVLNNIRHAHSFIRERLHNECDSRNLVVSRVIEVSNLQLVWGTKVNWFCFRVENLHLWPRTQKKHLEWKLLCLPGTLFSKELNCLGLQMMLRICILHLKRQDALIV